ncbi:hypothetical protein YTPLAS72_06210 [Nitrospira sp.]|nr:hypothetical protein YTPLAS72_06210 [Nitrospira sp.]
MRRRDKHERLIFCDFSLPDYDEQGTGFARIQLGQVIHAQWANGTIIKGVEVFQAMWEAVDWHVLVKLSRLSFLEPLLSRAYAWFARNRLRLTGRANICSQNTCATSLGWTQGGRQQLGSRQGVDLDEGR